MLLPAQQPETGRLLASAAAAGRIPPAGAPAELRASARIAPRAIQLVVVPVPPAFRSDQPVAFTITPLGGATIVPPLQGQVAAGESRTILVAASVAASALAGTRTVAQVDFTQNGIRFSVPVDLDVIRVPNAALRLTQTLFGANPGDRVTIRYALTNTGNGPDTLDVALGLPGDWKASVLTQRFDLGPGEATMGEAVVTVPRVSVSGVYSVTLTVSRGGAAQPVATGDAVIQLLENDGKTGRAALGPRMVAGMVTVLDADGHAGPVLGVQVEGRVADGVQAFGRLVEATDPGGADQRSISRVGYFAGAPFLTIAAAQWQLTGGTAGRSFSDVTGLSAYGRGASFNWTDGSRSAAGLLAVPTAASAPGGHLVGLRVGKEVWRPGAQVNATVTDLDDPGVASRRLRAFGIGAVSPPFSGVTVSGELAARHFATDNGFGWSTELKRQTRNEFGQLRAVHAPGGSTAFAHARDEIAATGTRTFGGRWFVSGGFWTSSDESPTFSALRSTGWSLAPRLAASRATSLDLELRANSFTAQSATGVLGNGETLLRLGVNSQRGRLFMSGAGTVGTVRQTAGIPGGTSLTTSGARQSLRLGGGITTDRGTFELSGSFEHNAAGIGLLANAAVVDLKATSVALTSGSHSPMLRGGLQLYQWFGDRPGAAVVRVGLVTPIPGDLALTFDVERNPFVAGQRWIPVLKLERSIRIPVGGWQPVARGQVFEDRNANGVRDVGEGPLTGAVVKRGAETIVTDREGRFRFYDKGDAPVRIDETSLPFGMVVNAAPSSEPQRARNIAIGVIPTADVEIQLVAATDSNGRTPHVDFAGVPVQAVDTAGNPWLTRADAKGRAHLSALPPGHYELEINFSGLREPVRLREAASGFTVEPGKIVPVITVPVFARPIRLFQPASDGGTGGR